MSIDAMIRALALPAQSLVNKRVPKTLLLEHGAPTAADKRYINDGIEEFTWVAALKPNNCGIPAFTSETHEYLEIAVLAVTLRPEAKLPRLYELIHRAIPYPLVLIAQGSDGVTLSLTHKRKALSGTAKVVIDPLVLSAALELSAPDANTQDFLAALPLARQPAQNLFAAYSGWVDCVHALAAAVVAGGYKLPATAERAAERREALAELQKLEEQIQALRKKAAREKQMDKRVALNLEVKRLEAALLECRSRL
jgi:hypothetical protein